MKKIIALATLFAVSSAAFAQGGFQETNNPQPQQQQMQKGFFDEANAIKTVKDAQAA